MTVMLLQSNACAFSGGPGAAAGQLGQLGQLGQKPPLPATIEEQYRQHCAAQLNKETTLHGSRPRLNVFSLPHTVVRRQGKAMNYYRLWIYTCNAVLLLSVLGFVIVSVRVVVADPRRKMIPGLTLHHPSLLYAYLALLTQSGLLQLLGCIGALKLNERLLNMYWLLLLFLLLGDAFIGIVWIFRFDQMYTDVKPILKQRLKGEYGVDPDFTRIWDAIQHDFQCCGVAGPQDFNDIDLPRKHANESLMNRTELVTEWPDENATDWIMSMNERDVKFVSNVPESCCRLLREQIPDEKQEEEVEETENKPTTIKQRLLNKAQKNKSTESRLMRRSVREVRTRGCRNKRHAAGHLRHDGHHYNASQRKKETLYATGNVRIMDTCAHVNGFSVGTIYGVSETLHFSVGCETKLKKWLRDSAHVLGVLGYCVIAFLKLCFLGILRYEIREMIHKIKLLQGELQPPVLLLSAESPAEQPPDPSAALCNHTEKPELRARTNSFLLLQPHESSQTTPVHQIRTIQMTQNHRLFSLTNDPGNESDTNSHCALLIEQELPPKQRTSNGNNNFESHELQDLFPRPTTQI